MTRERQEAKLADDIIGCLYPVLKEALPVKWKQNFRDYLSTLPKEEMLAMKVKFDTTISFISCIINCR